TAVNGRWQTGPGHGLFDAVQSSLGGLPFVAENLGIITDSVESLRHAYQMPGMSVLQFAFDGNPSNPNLPHNHERTGVTYTGTHDNNTTLGWWLTLSATTRQQVRDYLGHPAEPMPGALIRMAARSVSACAVFPMQDLLQLDSAARMNVPGHATGNWRWRFSWQQLEESLAGEMRQLLVQYGRAS
ncbi:MAG TPA: 4-alpha-glucanotransferase, partial [Gammaproteobacteria bacterium]